MPCKSNSVICVFVCVYIYKIFFSVEQTQLMLLRAGPKLRPIKPLPRVPLLEKAPNLGANILFLFFCI